MWRHDFLIQSLWERSRATNSAMENRIWLNFEPVRVLVSVIVPCMFEKDRSKMAKKTWRHHFPQYKSLGAVGCHGNQTFSQTHDKT